MVKTEKDKIKCKYCNLQIGVLETSNHIIGCNLEAVAQALRWKGYEEEADKLDKIASRIK